MTPRACLSFAACIVSVGSIAVASGCAGGGSEGSVALTDAAADHAPGNGSSGGKFGSTSSGSSSGSSSGGSSSSGGAGSSSGSASSSGGSSGGVDASSGDDAGGGSSSGSGSSSGGSSSGGSSSGSSSGGSSSGLGGPPCAGATGTELDMSQVTIYDNPPDLASWPVTTSLTEVDFVSGGLALTFSKKEPPNRWPDVTPPGWNGPLQYTIGIVECINGQWYGSAAIQVWYDLPSAGGNVASDINTLGACTTFGYGSTCQVAKNWYYDTNRWGMLAGRQPQTGETIGVFVAAGNLRDVTTDDTAQSPVMERSNIVLMPMPDFNGSTNSF